MEESNQKINFFKRIKIAIFKLEDYGIFLGEKFKVSLKYFLLLILLLSIVMAALDVYELSKMINKAYQYVQSELPEFTYNEGTLAFSENVDAYDSEYEFKLLINTNQNVNDEKLKEYKTQIYDGEYGIIALKDKFIYIVNGFEAEYSYQEFLETSSLEIKNKEDLENLFSQFGIPAMSTTFFVMDLIIIYISNLLTIFTDLLLIALFGLIAARFCGMKFKVLPMFSLSIYSLTLSIVLTAIYSIIYGLTGFVINYFSVMYLLIAYVYIIAAILMIKYDLIKQHFELEKIMEVQKQVHEELKKQENTDKEKEKEEEEKETKEEEKTKDSKKELDGADVNNNREPDGSEI